MASGGDKTQFAPGGGDDPNSDGMQRFTATGRPYRKNDYTSHGYDSIMASDGFAATQGSTLPFKYTDDSLIPVPVRKPCDPTDAQAPKKKSGLFGKLKGKKESNSNLIIKQIKRGEYLKHYAKDDQGFYSGTETPAEDCVLKDNDPVRATMMERDGWQSGKAGDINSLEASTATGGAHVSGQEKDDGVIR